MIAVSFAAPASTSVTVTLQPVSYTHLDVYKRQVLGALLSALCCGKGSFQRNVRRHAFAAVAALVTVVGIWMVTSAGEWQAVWEHAGAVEHIQDYTAYDQN